MVALRCEPGAEVWRSGIDEPLSSVTAVGTAFFEADGIGSITSLSGASGLTDTYTYKPFGITTATGSNPNRFRFTGREWDQETGLYYYRARYYDPQTGRFLSEDPARSGINFYRYVQNNPIDGTDPSGLWDTYTHSALFWNALKGCGVDDNTIWQIQQYSKALDQSLDSQMPWNAYMHSMSAPWQSPEDALQARDQWIDTNLAMAQSSYLSPSQPGGKARAPWTMFFAYAGHTMADSTSPAHTQNGVPIVWPSNPAQHGDFPGSIETWDNMTPPLMQQNIQAIQHAYERVTGKKCGCQQ